MYLCKYYARAGVDEVAKKSRRSRGAVVPCSRRYGRREPSRVLSCICLARNCYDPVRSRYLRYIYNIVRITLSVTVDLS